MAKTKEELNQLKTEYESLNNKLKELTDDELKQVTGGGPNDGINYISGTGDIRMYTSSMQEIYQSSSAKYFRKDSDKAFRVTSISNNYNPGENTAFSTTYFFKADDCNIYFSFIATKENNICYDLK